LEESRFNANPDKKLARSHFNKQAEYGGAHLQPQLLRRQRLGGLRFKASPGKKLVRSHLNQ
jgi:hypothetical protein